MGRFRGIPGQAIIAFASTKDAGRLVAGVPAAARAVREARLAGFAELTVAAPTLITDSAVIAECARIAEGPPPRLASFIELRPSAGTLLVAGDRIASPGTFISGAGDAVVLARGDLQQDREAMGILVAGDSRDRLAAAGHEVLLGTAKPTDGLVSRHINRPVSRAISGILLAMPGIRPVHATIGTAAISAAMLAALVGWEGDWGLVAGALLFQAASMFDGVDGEIARATFRSSRAGAALDSIVDATTNLAFLLGVALNLHWQGSHFSAQVGLSGLAMLLVGLALIGRASAKSHAPFSFDVVKEHYRARTGPALAPVVRGLTALTSRDFFALGFALLIASGMASQALALFALIATGWLAAVIFALAPRQA